MSQYDPRAEGYHVEYTDTFGGEPNYCWVQRRNLRHESYQLRYDGEPIRNITRRAKRLAKASVGLSGVRGVWHDFGDTHEFRPYKMCRVLFLNWQDGY